VFLLFILAAYINQNASADGQNHVFCRWWRKYGPSRKKQLIAYPIESDVVTGVASRERQIGVSIYWRVAAGPGGKGIVDSILGLERESLNLMAQPPALKGVEL
jgi:hypothetical protein